MSEKSQSDSEDVIDIKETNETPDEDFLVVENKSSSEEAEGISDEIKETEENAECISQGSVEAEESEQEIRDEDDKELETPSSVGKEEVEENKETVDNVQPIDPNTNTEDPQKTTPQSNNNSNDNTTALNETTNPNSSTKNQNAKSTNDTTITPDDENHDTLSDLQNSTTTTITTTTTTELEDSIRRDSSEVATSVSSPSSVKHVRANSTVVKHTPGRSLTAEGLEMDDDDGVGLGRSQTEVCEERGRKVSVGSGEFLLLGKDDKDEVVRMAEKWIPKYDNGVDMVDWSCLVNRTYAGILRQDPSEAIPRLGVIDEFGDFELLRQGQLQEPLGIESSPSGFFNKMKMEAKLKSERQARENAKVILNQIRQENVDLKMKHRDHMKQVVSDNTVA